jgi:hypothetical protein
MKKDLDLELKMEERLHGLLNPVVPRSSFIDELQNRLKDKPDISIEYPNYLISILIISSGFVLGSVLLLLLNKIFRITSKAKA